MNRLSIITHLSDKEQMILQYEQLIQEFRNQSDSTVILAICLNNLGALLHKNELLSKAILKFVKAHLLEVLPSALQYIVRMNMAKICTQLGLYSKAFLNAEIALQPYEQIAFTQLNQQVAVLLINGYVTLAKSYELATFDELAKIKKKSQLLTNGFKTTQIFYENSKKLLVKYVGVTHPFYKRFAGLSNRKSALLQKSFQETQEQTPFACQKAVTIRIMRLLETLKSSIPRMIEFQEIQQQTPQKNSLSRIKTTNDDSTIKLKQYRIKRPSKVEDDQETTTEIRKDHKPFKVKSMVKLEKMITNKVEEQVRIHFKKKVEEQSQNNDIDQKYQVLINEVIKIEKEKSFYDKQALEWKHQAKQLQEEINQLKVKIGETEQIHMKESKDLQVRHAEQIYHLTEQNQQLRMQIAKQTADRHNTTNNITLDDHQFFYFTDTFTGQVVFIPLLPNVSFIYQYENTQIEICQVQQTLKIQAKVQDKILNEIIEIVQLQDFLQFTQYNRTLPYPIKYLNNFKTFIQYLIVPFIQVVREQNEEKIAIWPYPQGLLQEQSINFLGGTCQWWIYNIGLRWFRVTIYSESEFIFQFDIHCDQQSFLTFFKQENVDEYELQEKEEILQHLSRLNQQSIQILESSKSLIHSTYYLPNVTILDKSKLINQINDYIKNIEGFLQQQRITSLKQLEKPNSQQIYCLQLSLNENKPQLQAVLIDNQKIVVKLKNLFQSVAPKNQSVFAEGSYEITNDFIKKRYGITFENLGTQEEKSYFFERLLDSFTLQIHTKEIDDDDQEMFKENAIVLRDLDYGGTHRIFYELKNYKAPIDFTLIGANDLPQFVKVDIFNQETNDQQSLLFNITEEYWIRPVITEVKGKKQKQQKYNKEFKVQGQYYLSQILQQCGWHILEQCLFLSDDKQLFIQRSDSPIGKLEQYINMKSVCELTK